jgi:glycosyltransferase involved in cell wall biosynthesis
MKLIIQIPCYNEAETLPMVVADLPRRIPGIDVVEYLVIDDGSTDGTAEVARALGVHHVVRHKRNSGLARTFATGLDACLRLGADVIVNTDGDNQYAGEDIAALIRPVVEGRADITVGDREPWHLAHFSWRKRLLQRLGSGVVQRLSGLDIPDAVSGFRAISRDAAIRLNIISLFSYTTEMLIQAGHKGLTVVSVPVRVNEQTRASRLFRSTWQFVERSALTMLRTYAMYQPLRTFVVIGLALSAIGALPIIRFLVLWLVEGGVGHIQSLVLGGVLLVLGFMCMLIGIVADLIGFNRRLLEMTLEAVRRGQLNAEAPPMPSRPPGLPETVGRGETRPWP